MQLRFFHIRDWLLPVLMFLALTTTVRSQDTTLTQLSLESMASFQPAGSNWQIAGRAVADRRQAHHLAAGAGTGVLVNLPTDEAESNLVTAWEHGDLRMAMDVMVPRGSNSGIYLQGRYEIQIIDSWGVKNPDYGDMGGIYQRWDASRPPGERGYQGKPPRVNVARAPGLWQHLTIDFRAPHFDESGTRIRNAVIDEITLNGVVIHENVVLTGPTRGPAFDGEAPRGPIVIQGDHGPVAFRNIRYRRYDSSQPALADSTNNQQSDPILIEPTSDFPVLRSFMYHDGAKRTHVASVGAPEGIHYAYDLEQGSLLKMWKGPFLETTKMWEGRGIEQVAEPRGSVIDHPGAPDAAFLPDGEAAWPDSLRPETDYEYVGYELGADDRPTFEYRLNGVHVFDTIGLSEDSSGFRRTLRFDALSEPARVLLARGDTIHPQPDGSYRVDGPSFYVEVHESHGQPVIRTSEGSEELLLQVPGSNDARISYTMIW